MKRLVLENRNDVVHQIRCYLEKNSEAKFIHRLQVILLFADAEDNSCDSLGALFGNSPRSVSNWVKKVNQTGDVESLRSISPSGRPSRLSEVHKEEIKMVLHTLPEQQGMQGRKWNGRLLSFYISQHYGISLNIRSCQRLFRELTAII
jgi:transposase